MDSIREQYKNPDNLYARMNIYRYDRNKADFNGWFFTKMKLPETGDILELGCGSGVHWKNYESKVKESQHVILSDLSEGMLTSAKQNLSNPNFHYQLIDIRDIPYEDHHFDVIISRHMLYLVDDLEKALGEVKRVLKPDGVFYASANSKAHLQKLTQLVNGYDISIPFNLQKFSDKFGTESGVAILKNYFREVNCETFSGQLEIKQAEPVVSYVMSTKAGKRLSDENRRGQFERYVENEIKKTGVFRITTKTGMLTASEPL